MAIAEAFGLCVFLRLLLTSVGQERKDFAGKRHVPVLSGCFQLLIQGEYRPGKVATADVVDSEARKGIEEAERNRRDILEMPESKDSEDLKMATSHCLFCPCSDQAVSYLWTGFNIFSR